MDSVKQTPLSKDHIGGLWSQTQLDDATEDTFEAAVDFVRQVEKAHGIGVAEPAQQDTKPIFKPNALDIADKNGMDLS